MDGGVIEGLAIAGTVATIATTAASAYSQAQSASYNQKVAQNNANSAVQQAQYQNSLKQIQLEKSLGAQRAAAAASGVTGGSLDDISYDTLIMGKYDQLATTYEGKIAATRSQSEAQLDSMSANNSLIGGGIAAFGDALSGASTSYKDSSLSGGMGLKADYAGYYPSNGGE